MVLPPPQRRTFKTGTDRCSKSSALASKHHHSVDERKQHCRGMPVRCNAMTQTEVPSTSRPVYVTPTVKSLAAVDFSASTAVHWSLATSKGMKKMPDSNNCLNASEKVLAACHAVEISASSLHSLVECLCHLPQTSENCKPEREYVVNRRTSEGEEKRSRHAAGSNYDSTNRRSAGGYVKPLSTSSPVEMAKDARARCLSPNVANELALLLEKVRELRAAAAEADSELNSLRSENAYLRRQQMQSLKRFSADTMLPNLNVAKTCSSQQTVPMSAPSSSDVAATKTAVTKSSPLAKYPHLRTLLLPVTSGLLESVAQEDLPVVNNPSCFADSPPTRSSGSVPTYTFSSSVQPVASLTASATTASSSPFYAAMQSADDGLSRLRRHFGAVQLLQSNSFGSLC